MQKERRSIKGERKARAAKRKKRIFLFIILPVLLLAISATAYGAYLYNKAESVLEDSYNPLERNSTRTAAVEPEIDNVSVLIIGVDDSSKREFSDSARSDALMVATFNKKAKSVKLLSIPRDSYVYIPKLGYEDKITHAHANGGPTTTIETVENLLEIPIDFYIKVNFNAFIDIVDALDGIEVEVPYAFSEQDSHDRADAISLEEGLQELDGEEALALARTRKLDNDIERGKRQQEIVKAIINKTISAGSITKYADVIEAIGNNMETDLSFEQMKAFLDYVAKGTALDIESLILNGQDLWIPNKYGQDVYYYGLDEQNLSTIKTTLRAHLDLGSTSIGQGPIENIEEEQEQAQGNY